MQGPRHMQKGRVVSIIFFFLKTHKFITYILFASIRLFCLNEWIVVKSEILGCICIEILKLRNKTGVLLCRVVYKIFVPKLYRPYLNIL